jgi:hypothetical protein
MVTDKEIEVAARAIYNSDSSHLKPKWEVHKRIYIHAAKAALEAAEQERSKQMDEHLESFYKSGGKIMSKNKISALKVRQKFMDSIRETDGGGELCKVGVDFGLTGDDPYLFIQKVIEFYGVPHKAAEQSRQEGHKTLTDKIAIAAMQGILASGEYNCDAVKRIISDSFNLTDEFLKQREVKEDDRN